MFGYHGLALGIDLSTGRSRPLPLPDELLAGVIGGTGLGTWLLLRHSAPGYDPLAPDAPLVVAFAPLAGTALNTSAKAAVLCKSPLTGRLNDAMISSRFALEGKAAGADALVITGACRELSVLLVEPAGVRVEPAPELAGLTAREAEERLHARWGEDWSVAAIGAAGEARVPFAILSHDGRHAGRGGTGAVLGSKRLKAIAVRGGAAAPALAHPDQVQALRKSLQAASLGPGTEKYRSTGTLGNLLVFNRLGILPTRNFRGGSDEGAEALSVERLSAQGRVSRTTCADCMIGCEKRVTTASGQSTRLEYENVYALGPLLGVWDMDLVLEASHRCDELGLDTITAGGTLAFAQECAQKGLLDVPELRAPAQDWLLEALGRIVSGEGYGKLLALGSRELSCRIGQGSEAFAPHVKGLEIPGYHPAGLQTLALGLAVGSRGADHNKSGAYDLDLSGKVNRFGLGAEDLPQRIGEMVELENQAAVIDSLILCKFVRRALKDVYEDGATMLRAVTGHPFTPQGLQAAAQRIHHLKKLFNQRQGWTHAEDVLPARFFAVEAAGESPPAADANGGPAGIDPAQFRAARARYYLQRGWDAQGRLSTEPQLLEELHLSA